MIYIFLIVFLVFLDQISKFLIVKNLELSATIPLIKNIFHLTYVRNTGAAFSIFRDKKAFLLIVAFVGISAVSVYFYSLIKTSGNALLKVGIAFIIAGGIGNLIDRARLSYVVDFFDFRLINFAIFNVADVFIVLGAFLLFVDTFFVSKTLQKL